MDIVSLCPLRASGVVWQSQAGAFAQTVIVKATYVLRPGESALAPEQDEPNEEDNHWNDDPTRSVYAPSDRAPFKPKADVMLVGHAFAPGKQPVRSLTARLIVGEIDKSIEVWCDRGFRMPEGQLLEGPRIAKVPLRWERAAGGPDTNNPVGTRFDASPDVYGMVALPNLQPPGTFVCQRSDTFVPVCFAPIAGRWPGRTLKLGHFAETLAAGKWEASPLPKALDYSYFQAAPADQQVSEIRANERLVLENLHPEHAKLVTSLPGIRPAVLVERATGEREQVALLADTLWIDTDRGICTVVWRGRIGLRHAEESGRIAVSMEQAATGVRAAGLTEADEDSESERTLTPGYKEFGGNDPSFMTIVGELVGSGGAASVMPFSGSSGPPNEPATGVAAPRPNDAALPFGRASGAPAPMRASKPQEISMPAGGMLNPSITLTGEVRTIPDALATAPPSPPPLVEVKPPALSPPPIVTLPPRIEPIAPPNVVSPWASGGTDAASAPTAASFVSLASAETPKLIQPALAPAPVRAELQDPLVGDEAAAKRGWKPVGLRSGNGSKGPPLSPNAALGGAVAASDAAAAASGRKDGSERAAVKGSAAPLASPPKAVIELLWYDPVAIPRIRRQPGWKEVIGQIRGKAFEDELSGDSPPEKRQDAKDRRDVAGLLARGDAEDMTGLEAALANAVTEDGTFVPPLVLLAGELEFPFDELETLKATIAALTPLAPGDKRLKETLDTTEELLKTPWLKGATGIAEGLTTKLKEVYGQGSRMLPPRYLESHTERMLLDQRAYQKRTVLGKVCIRSLLSVQGAQGGVPVYLPESLGQELPAFQRFMVRMVGEGRMQLDSAEPQNIALRAVVLSRALHTPARR